MAEPIRFYLAEHVPLAVTLGVRRRDRQLTIAGRGESLASTVLPAVILPVDAVLG